MTQANDSITVTPGTGATVATHIPAGASKEYQVVMVAGMSGHIEGTKPTYMLTLQDQNTNASQIDFDLWNGSASNVIKIQGLWAVSGGDVANNSALATRLDLFRTSAVGTGGTASSYNSTTIVNANITPCDSTNAALPSGVSARALPTGGATSSSWLFSFYAFTEELAAQSYDQQGINIMPDSKRGAQDMTLNPSEGLKVVQGTVDSAGTLGFLVLFTVE